MKLVYLGTPAMAVPPLHALIGDGHEVLLVVTRVDKRRGRGGELSASPVKAAALELGIPVSHDVDDVIVAGAELGVVVAYGRIIKPHVLAALPMINLHFSLLPRWRGAAPVERAILAGDRETGVDVMAVEEGLDTGGVFAEVRVPIGDATTADELRATLVEAGSKLLVASLRDGLGSPRPQAGEPTSAAKIEAADLRLDWSGDPVRIDRQVRVGGAWTTFRGARCKIHDGAIQDGAYLPSVIQLEGKPRVEFAAWRNGARLAPGEWFE